MTRRIVYLQYTDPAAYPPLQHSATILAEQGWQVLFLGIAAAGAATLQLPKHERLRARRMGGPSGGQLGVLKYGTFTARTLLAAVRFRPDWIYVSDALAAPAALVTRRALRAAMVYHEHDAPTNLPAVVMRARAELAERADLVIAPTAARLAMIPAGRGPRLVVWNCPRRSEALPNATRTTDDFRLVYHGSLSRERLTPAFIDALALLPRQVRLDIFGYETAGHRGYTFELLERAEAAGVRERVHYHGAIPQRAELLRALRDHNLGIATVALAATDQNLATLAGASNKAFEYLACGLPILISADPAWQRMFEAPGYAVSCLPTDARSITSAVRRMMDNRAMARAAGQAGREHILHDWNYETQFAPVLKLLTG